MLYDESLNAMAFNPRGIPFDARLKPLYGSDIGHWPLRLPRGTDALARVADKDAFVAQETAKRRAPRRAH
jgi:hypothetical protein